jgi:predicted O-methyltransferase YrrM
MSHQSEQTWQYADTGLLLLGLVLLVAVSVGAWMMIGPLAGFIVVLAVFAMLAGLQLHLYRRRKADDIQQQRHMQALLFLFSAFNFRAPLPSLTGWAVSPELAATLVGLIRAHKPRIIVELGSGSSTIVMGYAVEQQGAGRIISLDHSAQYGAETRRDLARHALQDWTEVHRAPLTSIEQNGETWTWYDLSALEDDISIDMLLVDGPPHETGAMARYPALPALYEYLSEDAVVVLDDAYRSEEKEILDRWMQDYDDFELDIRESPKGTAVLHRTPADGSATGATLSAASLGAK